MNYYRNILIVAAIAIFYTNIPGYMNFLTQDSNMAPVNWVTGFVVLALPLLIRKISTSDNVKSPLIVWCFGYAWITAVWFFLSSQSDMAWQEVRWRVFAIIQLLVFFFLFSDKQTVRLARQTLVGGVLLGVAINIYELFVPMSFSTVLGRSAGLYRNPTLTGEALVMGMLCSVTVLPSRFRAIFILLAGIGVFATLSRGGILAWVITVIGLMFVGGVRVKDFLVSTSVGFLLIAVVLMPWLPQLYATLGSVGVLNKDVEERLAWLTDPTGVSDNSSWERAYLAKQAWDKIAEHPFLGSGTGSSREWVMGAHNQNLTLMLDHGLLGVAILPLLVLAVIWETRRETRPLAMVFGATAMVLSLFTHTFLNETYSLLLFALMAAMAFSSREGETKRIQAMTSSKLSSSKTLVKT